MSTSLNLFPLKAGITPENVSDELCEHDFYKSHYTEHGEAFYPAYDNCRDFPQYCRWLLEMRYFVDNEPFAVHSCVSCKPIDQDDLTYFREQMTEIAWLESKGFWKYSTALTLPQGDEGYKEGVVEQHLEWLIKWQGRYIVGQWD